MGVLILLAALGAMAGFAAVEDDAQRILVARCGACHSGSATGGLRLDSEEGFKKGGKSGRRTSEVIPVALRGGGSGIKAMPPGKPLTGAEIETIEKWIAAGAKFPVQHWAFAPLGAAKGSIDDWIEARRGNTQLAAMADRRTLIRRLSFDLTGLPPQGEFRDERPGWQERLVDQLLASPHYGEHWGRHWLDVARYGEDDFSGTAVQPYPNAWRYRDWVIRAINRNMPYDEFLMAQLAGDLTGKPEHLGGLGLNGLGPWYYGIAQPPQARADERHDRVDMVSRGMLGLTVACARCHDHKYDPISQKDYYALSGVFASSAYKEYPLVSAEEAQRWDGAKRALDAAEKALAKFLDEVASKLREQYAPDMDRYMMATISGDATGLDTELLNRWCEYLRRDEENHPYLREWQQSRSAEAAKRFRELMLEIAAEKKMLDQENTKVVEAAKASAPKPKRTIVLPGGYRSDEDFNPGADVVVKSLARDRFVAYNRTFVEGAAPLRFPTEIIPRYLRGEERERYNSLKAERDRLKAALGPKYPYIDGISEFEAIDLPVDRRGNPEDPGEIVARRFPLVLSGGKVIPFQKGSGRLQLAETVAHHPLAARVAVNRIWMHLFGQGIVRTPSNFGLAGDRPSNPELLEYLAARFVALGYDQKALIREIVLSLAYQRASVAADDRDPDNRLFARQNRRRLAAEPLRDAMLAAAGVIDLTVGGPSEELTPKMNRRTVYAKVGRFQANETLSLFDHPNAAVTCEQRVVTNVPLQKLFYLNSEIVARAAEALGQRLKKLGIERGYRTLFDREPTRAEKQAAKQFFNDGGTWAQYAQVLLSTNEFAYVD
jgi:cytochrome c553